MAKEADCDERLNPAATSMEASPLTQQSRPRSFQPKIANLYENLFKVRFDESHWSMTLKRLEWRWCRSPRGVLVRVFSSQTRHTKFAASGRGLGPGRPPAFSGTKAWQWCLCNKLNSISVGNSTAFCPSHQSSKDCQCSSRWECTWCKQINLPGSRPCLTLTGSDFDSLSRGRFSQTIRKPECRYYCCSCRSKWSRCSLSRIR